MIHCDETAAPRSRRRMLVCLAIILVGLAGFGAFGLARRASPPPAAKPKPALTVTVAAPRRTVWPVSFSAQGSIAPWQETSVGAQVGGYPLIDVRANVGDRVSKGDVLARIDPALLKTEEARLEANYAEAEANRQRALDLQLRASGAISAMNVLQLVTKARMAAAELAANRLQLRHTVVVAPDDGTISARTATLGAVAGVGQELFRLICRDRLEWRGELTAAQIAQVTRGQTIALDLPDGSRAVARVRQTAPGLDPRSRLGIVYADLEPGSRARAGMYAKGSVKLGDSPALVVPATSVIIRDGRNYVAKPADPGLTPRVILAEVTVGRRNGTDVEIVQGLADSDRVVARGTAFLNDGDVVRLATAEGPRTSGASGKRTP
ncbi:efflux RND transporter periplasmic adaptor subunit [Sphingomonas sp. BT-65]|uniref:efflux RND transporter periplasmic adaptor subunit n=1 Tax=Sphingomonas sp. BT-65 TaxID=2989821 RepID=UPI0022360AA3|nr:efflux RND transporter periplasmic adaptor subunit [Sphingomonas sp. BT-65]MCW4460676.1 efflux RND transporter periplasmic adaptor subunit [Sphingomonas sp. BT-65]